MRMIFEYKDGMTFVCRKETEALCIEEADLYVKFHGELVMYSEIEEDSIFFPKDGWQPDGEQFEVTETSDAFPSLEDSFAIWDNAFGSYYADVDGRILTYKTMASAKRALARIRRKLDA